ncbi:hypothetical protein [Kribbella deserti]|uniref:Uncharacterized protein n=1 Tax=Kribbella deserti TaxID=1926257 RepID=A0ABV6QI78_9ACTN
MRKSPLAVCVVTVVVLVSSCSSPSDDQGQTPPTTSTSKSSGSAPAPQWTRLRRGPVDGDHLIGFDGPFLVMRASDPAGTTTIIDRSTDKVVLRHKPEAGFVAQSPVVLAGRWALIQDIRSEGPAPQIRATRYNLDAGTKQDLGSVKGLPRITEPEIGANGATFAYTTTGAKELSCLVVADLGTLENRMVGCVQAPGYLADPIISADSVTYSEITAPGTAKRCKRLLTASLTGGFAKAIAPMRPCIQWSGATLNGTTVWSEVPADAPNQYQSEAYLRTNAAAPTRRLGQILTDTIVPCGSWIYWQVRRVTGGVEHFEIHRWREGADPQSVFVSEPETALTAPTCQDSQLLIESATLGAGAKHADALVTVAS